MAIYCGFFNSQNKDRLYTAEDMTKPYELLVSNGVFATQEGTPSNYLQVYASDPASMNITVKAGRGIFYDKWFINDADMVITIDQAEPTLNRIDTIVVRVDKTATVRNGSIIVKKGTPSSSPVAPSIETGDYGIKEYRLANIYVAARSVSIAQKSITDMRGSADCPWVTSLVQQVDTSTLFIQWQEAFDDWFGTVKETLATSTLIRSYNSSYTTGAQDETSIPINISQFNRYLDILQVYVNGLMLIKDVEYTVVDDTKITLTLPVDKGTPVSFVVYKSVDGSDAETVVQQVYELQNIVSASKITNDTGGVKLSITSGDLLASFKGLGKGFHTILASNNVTNIPQSGQYYRCFGHITDVPYGWIIAVSDNGKAFVNFATGESTWTGWKELTNSTQITNDDGDVEISISSSVLSVLDAFKNAGVGVHTIYSAAGVLGAPAQGAFRYIGHLTGEGNGWLMAFQANGSVFANYLVGEEWKGWKTIYNSNPSALWTGQSFMDESANITPSKRLSECANGWLLLWSDYDDSTSTANTYDNVTTMVPKLNGVQNDWNGSSLLCMIPTDVTAEGVATTCVKRVYIYDDHITGFAGNNVGAAARDVVLRAIYEY